MMMHPGEELDEEVEEEIEDPVPLPSTDFDDDDHAYWPPASKPTDL